jgi:hypothetical protein
MQNFMSQRQQSELGGRLQSNRGISSRLRQLDASSRSVVESDDQLGESFVCDKEVCGSL